jgi:hypothetical protein
VQVGVLEIDLQPRSLTTSTNRVHSLPAGPRWTLQCETSAASAVRFSGVAQLLIPVGRSSLRCEVEQVPDRLEGANVAGILSGVGRCVEELRAPDPATGWHGGAVKPDLSPSPTCSNYHPQLSGFILTGAAATDWRRSATEVGTQTEVLQAAQTVDREWHLAVQTPTAVPCLRIFYAKKFAAVGARLVSFKQIAFPHDAPYAAAYRGLPKQQARASSSSSPSSERAAQRSWHPSADCPLHERGSPRSCCAWGGSLWHAFKSERQVQRARLEVALLDPQVARDVGIVSANLLDEALGVLATDEHLDGVAQRAGWRERVVDDCVDNHGAQLRRRRPCDCERGRRLRSPTGS